MDNFGQIKHIYNSLLAEGISANDTIKKTEFKKYLKTIKENKILKSQFDIYYAIENAFESDHSKAMTYVNECLSMVDSFQKNDIIKANQKLSESIKDNEQELHPSKLKLYESIHLLLTTKKTPSTIPTIVEAKHTIVDYILNNKKEEISEGYGLPNSVLAEIATDKFNSAYADLNESQKQAIDVLLNGDEITKENLYKNTIKECLELVNSKLTEATSDIKEKLLATKENLLNRVYVAETFVNDLSKVLELKDYLKD